MTKPRIHIIGGPGSGKSFVAAELSRRLGVPAYDLDDLFWDKSVSHAFDGRHLPEARESISGRGRQLVACTTAEQVFAATSRFRFQRRAPR